MEELLTVRDLRVSYASRRRGARFAAVKGVDLDVGAEEIVALVGESGSGKTTLARAVVGLTRADSGTIAFCGVPVGRPGRWPPAQRRAVQMVFQDPKSSLNPRMPVEKIIAEAWRAHPEAAPEGDRHRAVGGLLDQVGLDGTVAGRRPGELSGGQCQRVSIARALALRPALLVCDEAVSALDVSVQAQILGLFAELRGRHGLSLLFISHDLGVVRQIADRVAVMYLGEIVECAPTEEIFTAPRHPYTRMLLDAALDFVV